MTKPKKPLTAKSSGELTHRADGGELSAMSCLAVNFNPENRVELICRRNYYYHHHHQPSVPVWVRLSTEDAESAIPFPGHDLRYHVRLAKDANNDDHTQTR